MKRAALSSKQLAIGRSDQPVGCGGFALLEVLVAFTILTLFLSVLFQVFSTGVRSARLGEEYTRAVLLAESKLASLGAQDDVQEGEESGSFDDVYDWRASLEVYEWRESASPGELPVRPFVASVEVSWGDGEQRRSVALTSLTLVHDTVRGAAERE